MDNISQVPVRKIVGLWLLLRFLTSLVALVASVFPRGAPPAFEFTHLEFGVKAWPPSLPLNDWIERITVAPWFRWDAKYYVWATTDGFSLSDGTASFHPLLPLLAKPLYLLIGSPLVAILLVSTLATLALYFAFYQLARLDLTRETAWKATLVLAVYPGSYVFYAPYTESLFLLFSILMFVAARKQQWLVAGILAALATLTRQQGLFLMAPLAWEIWKAREPRSGSMLSILLIPIAYGSWVVYRNFALSDAAPDISSLHGIVYSVLLSPSTHNVVLEQSFLFPLHALYLGFSRLWQTPNIPTSVDLFFGLLFLALTVIAWRHLTTSYRIYSIIIILVSFAFNTGTLASSPYMGLPRHLLLAFPVFIGLAPRLTDYAMSKVFKVGLFGMLLLTFFHCLRLWVP